MNRRAVQALIVLLWVFLAIFAIVKLFFAEWLIAVVDNEKILQIGCLIDNSPWIRLIMNTLLSLLGMQFYLCSCKQVWRLPGLQYLWLSLYTLALNIAYAYLPGVTAYVDLAGFILIPILLKASLKQTVVVFVVHQIGQLLVLFIRSEPLYLYTTNYATRFLLLFDSYIWLVLYYLYSNLYKEKTLWEWLGFHSLGTKRKKNLKRNWKE